jgi:hypothetical protein
MRTREIVQEIGPTAIATLLLFGATAVRSGEGVVVGAIALSISIGWLIRKWR